MLCYILLCVLYIIRCTDERAHVELVLADLALYGGAALHVQVDDVLGELAVELGIVLVLR